jgi:hypothetical protein
VSAFEAILIPGGGVREKGELPLWTRRRLDRAIEVHTGEYIITLSAGTPHKAPPLDDDGFPVFESVAAAHYLIAHGLDPRRIWTETSSYDTVGNAYFSRVIHIDPGGLRRLLIITSEFHRPRTESIFRWVYGLDAPSGGYDLCFDQVTDEGIDRDALAARRGKERASLQRLNEIKSKIHTLQQLHEWLFGEHAAYSASLSPAKVMGKLRDTY